MTIKKIVIENYKCFGERFELDLNPGTNILVGDNEVGKSTLLEAIHLALSGLISGKYIRNELSQSLFNNKAVEEYLNGFIISQIKEPPSILIELYFDINDANFVGDQNAYSVIHTGIRFSISLSTHYAAVYNALIDSGEKFNSLPIEYYDCVWSSFARDYNLIPRNIPIKSALIDSTNTKLQSGSDLYISRIIQENLTDNDKVKISQVQRKLKDDFLSHKDIQIINNNLNEDPVSEKKIHLTLDLESRNAWEKNLITYVDDIPFHFIGKGEQALIKTKLALNHKKTKEAQVLLLEEPENHLTHVRLNKLIQFITDAQDRQVIISTHSSFVANKLGLDSLILLNHVGNSVSKIRLKDLEEITQNYFKILTGYDTLRLILSAKTILVEGPSDELIVQKAYLQKYKKLPIEDCIEVISVGTAFLRFLEIADKVGKHTVVVTDNDGDFDNKITKKYAKFKDSDYIQICADNNILLNTLEPQIVDANKSNLSVLRKVLGIKDLDYPDSISIIKYMSGNNKTDCALKIFEDEKNEIIFPTYIINAIDIAHGTP